MSEEIKQEIPKHEYNNIGFCIHCSLARSFLEKSRQPCLSESQRAKRLAGIAKRQAEYEQIKAQAPRVERPAQPETPEKSNARDGDWTLVPISGAVVGIVMFISRTHMTGIVWLLPTGLVYAISITNPGFRFSWLQRIIATVITLVIGTYGQDILVWFGSLYKNP